MKSVEQTYQKVSQLEHVLLRPDTYVGSITSVQDNMWVLDQASTTMVYEKISYVPGLYKIFDEILVNAADNYQRDHRMTKIEVDIQKNGLITVLNDGKTIPIQMHKQHKMWVSELIFGHLLTSSNYQDTQKKVTGGRNGYGAKLANIFSTKFTVETADSASKKIMTLKWNSNMSEMAPADIKSYPQGKDYTKISFMPDYKRFGLSNGLTREMQALMKKRVYDLAGILKVKVFLNKQLVPVRTFKQYALMYLQNNQSDLIFDQTIISKRWSVLITKSDGQFQQISFVNGICTTKGGAHVNHIADQIVEQLMPGLKKKAKDISIKNFHIKNQMRIFVNCLIENPSFDSQTKETLTTTASKFGSTFQVTDKMIKQIQKSGICDSILTSLRAKENNKIDKQLKKIKNNKFVIPKLQQANMAGKSNKCTLILTEGDSAKTLAMSGIEKLKRDFYGVFPLKGKPANVRECTVKQVMDNQQLSNIVKILGLSFGKQYKSTESLRYASVMIMADQDIDGSHIKGLLINFFQTFWPSLCKINGFLKEFVTPIIRCKSNNGNEVIDFFSQTDYQVWKIDANTDWKIKYYKGLGTSTHAQAKQYFSNLSKHQIQFKYTDERDSQAMQLAFKKACVDKRKEWLENYDPSINVDYTQKTLKIQDFINKQFIHFSTYDNVRSIPSMVDGLKPSQRKILYACFKRNLRNQIKVAQLVGYVAEHSSYHHGQLSLSSTIIGMAQNYIGSNNLNLLEPIGQFGTRYLRGKDHASARYIFTNLNPLTRYLFNQADDHIVDYLEQENISIQPKYYIPILPLVLINGCQGIGTGWSTIVTPHKVSDVITLVRKRINRLPHVLKIGWQGFNGQVLLENQNSYLVRGNFEIRGDVVNITEIPPNRSIQSYKSFLQQRLDSMDNTDPDIEDIRENHQDGNVRFSITFIEGKQPVDDQMEKYLKLSTNIQQNNMVLFDTKQKLKKYQTVQDIIEQFYEVRIEAYKKRKKYLISRFARELEILNSKISFVREVIDGKFKMMDKKDSWVKQLVRSGFKSYNQLTKTESTKKIEYTNESEQSCKDYNYLLSIPIWNFCQQKIAQFESTKKEVEAIVNYYKKVTQIQLWQKDLDEFEKMWNIQRASRFPHENEDIRNGRKTNGNRGKRFRISQGDSQDQLIQNGYQDAQQQSQSQRSVSVTQRRKGRRNIPKEKEVVKTKKTLSKKNLMEQSVLSKNGQSGKKSKPEEQGEDCKPLDLILNKYLATGNSDGLTFEQRIRAKMASYENTFSYNKKEDQKQKENNCNKDNCQQEISQEKVEKVQLQFEPMMEEKQQNSSRKELRSDRRIIQKKESKSKNGQSKDKKANDDKKNQQEWSWLLQN